MEYKEIQDALHRLDGVTRLLEEMYEENGGEITEETTAAEAVAEELRNLLTTEGVDMLGRWLKSREDERQTLKEETAYIDRKIKTLDESIAFIKARLYDVLRATGKEKVKGSHGYSFKMREGRTVTVNQDILAREYFDIAHEAVKGLLPKDVSIRLTASVSAFRTFNGDAAELPAYYDEKVTPTVTFTKPRGKED